MSMKINPRKKGLRKTLNEYQELALRSVWETGENGAITKQVYDYVVERLSPGETISRASIIFFLKDMADEGVLRFEEVTGKGGYRRVYYPSMDERGYKVFLAKSVFESLMRDFPEETITAYRELLTRIGRAGPVWSLKIRSSICLCF